MAQDAGFLVAAPEALGEDLPVDDQERRDRLLAFLEALSRELQRAAHEPLVCHYSRAAAIASSSVAPDRGDGTFAAAATTSGRLAR